jgi:hypothetical protein
MSGWRFGAVMAAAMSASACAAEPSLRGADLDAYVLSRSQPEALAVALASRLNAMPAGNPWRNGPAIAVLRDALGEGMVELAPASRFATLPEVAAPRLTNSLADAPSLKLAALALPAPPEPPTVYAVVLGRFESAGLAASVWTELAGADSLAVKGLTVKYAPIKGQGDAVTLLAGPLPDQETAAGRCTAFAALGISCSPGAFEGRPLQAQANGPNG